MPTARRGARTRALVVGNSRAGGDAAGAGHPVRLRVDRAVGAEARPGDHGDGRARPADPAIGRRPARGGVQVGGGLRGLRRAAVHLRPDVVALARADPPGAGARAGRARRRARLARLVGALHLRGARSRGGRALAHHPEGARVRADGGDRGGGDDIAARMGRRRAELGLPPLLAPRRHADPLLAHARRLPRRGARLARVALAGRRGRPLQDSDHVWPGGRAQADRDGDPLAGRLRGLEAGAGRQRGERAVPAGCLRRSPGGAAPRPQVGAGRGRGVVEPRTAPCWSSSRGRGSSRTRASGR